MRRIDERTLGETGTEETRDLLNEGLRGQKRVVLLGELLDKLLVLVEPVSDTLELAKRGRVIQ